MRNRALGLRASLALASFGFLASISELGLDDYLGGTAVLGLVMALLGLLALRQRGPISG